MFIHGLWAFFNSIQKLLPVPTLKLDANEIVIIDCDDYTTAEEVDRRGEVKLSATVNASLKILDNGIGGSGSLSFGIKPSRIKTGDFNSIRFNTEILAALSGSASAISKPTIDMTRIIYRKANTLEIYPEIKRLE